MSTNSSRKPRKLSEGKMQNAIAELLVGMGVDINDPNYIDTPARVAKMYCEMLSPQPNNMKTFPSSNSDIVLLRGHKVVAICPHHLMPVEIHCNIAYIPHKLTLGLSKLARVVEQHLTKPCLQEDLAHEVAESLHAALDPKGVGVVFSGVHGCMRFRGVQTDADVITSVMKGVFLLNPNAKSELMQLIGRP